MSRKLCIENLNRTVDCQDLSRLFEPHGAVKSTEVMSPGSGAAEANAPRRDCVTGYVEMALEADGDAAIAALNGRSFAGRLLAVAWAPQENTQPPPKMFGSMNMSNDEAPLVKDGSESKDFGDRAGSGRDRGLPPPQVAVAEMESDRMSDWGPFKPAETARLSVRPVATA